MGFCGVTNANQPRVSYGGVFPIPSTNITQVSLGLIGHTTLVLLIPQDVCVMGIGAVGWSIFTGVVKRGAEAPS